MAKEIKGQMSLFEPDFIKDMDCTADTPVKRGVPDEVYVEDWKYPAGAFHGAEGGPC